VSDSTVKEFSFKVLDCFDELARPELKNIVMIKIWNYVRGYSKKIIEKKPDQELQEKLFKVYEILHPMFKDTEISVSINAGESLGSPKIPNVGELAKTKKLTKVNERQALKLIEDLKL